MNPKRTKLLLVGLLLAALVLACEFSFSSANIPEAYMALDADGQQATTTFGGSDVFYAIVAVANAPDDTTVEARWYAVNAEGVDPEYLIDQASTTTSDTTLYFHLSNDMLWPPGQYRVDIYLNGELDTSLDFTVQ